MNAVPLSIKIYGDVAVVHYMSQWGSENADGTKTTTWARWTDVVLKRDGRWGWIADHGGQNAIYTTGSS